MLEKLFLRHIDWLKIVKSFGGDHSFAEDVVQDMYLKIGQMIEAGLDINYKEDINYWYIYMTLKSIFLNHTKRKKKIKYVDSINLPTLRDVGIDHIDNYLIDNSIYLVDEKIQGTLKSMHWYDSKVWEELQLKSIAELSRQTDISYRSLYNTKVKIDKKLREIAKDNGIW